MFDALVHHVTVIRTINCSFLFANRNAAKGRGHCPEDLLNA